MSFKVRRLEETPDLGATAPAANPDTGFVFRPYFRQGAWYYKNSAAAEIPLVIPPSPGFYTDTAGGVALANGVGNQVQVVFNNSNIAGANYTVVAGEIQVDVAGTYEISYTCDIDSVDNTGGQRAAFVARILLDNVLVAGSETAQYTREGNTLHGFSATKTFPLVIAAGETIGLYCYRTNGTTTLQTSTRSSIYLKRIG